MVRVIQKPQIAVERHKAEHIIHPAAANEKDVDLTFTGNEFWAQQRANRPKCEEL